MCDASITGPIPDARFCEECGAQPTAPQQKACHECGAPLVPDPLLGRTLEDRYEVVRRLGAGAMGAVYEVRHLRLGKRFAMKIIRRSLGQEPEFAARFEQEALSTSRLEHPNCIAVTDYGQTRDGLLYLVMEFLEGHPLSSLLGEPLPVLRALRLTRQILLGLQHAHQAGVVHRDVKPENAMVLDPDGAGASEQVKVLDFGIAKLPRGGASEDGKGSSSRLTEAGVVFGTPDYMPPEQALGSADVDERADLYAVGVILWNMLTARQLFEADNSIELLQKKLAQDPPSLGRVCPGVFSPQLERVVARALARNPRERIASAAEFIVAIDAVLEERGRGLAAAAEGSVLGRLSPLWSRALSLSEKTWRGARDVASDWYRCGGTVAPTWGDRLQGLVRRRSGRIVLAAGGGAAALCALALVLALAGADAGPTVPPLPAQAAPAKQQGKQPPAEPLPRPRNATERSLHMARLLLGKYACREAAIEMKNLLHREPELAAAHYLLGAALICQREHAEGLDAYARAIKRAPEQYRTDARVLEDATTLLRARKRRTRLLALKFLEQHLGLAAQKALLGAATHRDREVRQAAVAALVRLGASGAIDWVTSLHLDLKQLSCSTVKSRHIVERLREINDPRVLGILKQARDARAGWFRQRSRFGCVMGEIKAAIKVVEQRFAKSAD